MNQYEFKPTDAQRRFKSDLRRERIDDAPFTPFRRGLDGAEVVRSAMVAAIAMSLYRFNVNANERARAVAAHFTIIRAPCPEHDELVRWVDDPCWATEMPMPSAFAYMTDALDRYGAEASTRIRRHEGPMGGLLGGILGCGELGDLLS